MGAANMQNGTDGVDYGSSVNRDAPLSNAAKHQMKPWEIIADNLKKAGWSWGCVGALDSQGRMIWIADAHHEGKRFVVRAYDKPTAFVELERAVCINLLSED
jgi:hypothetical protein